MQNQSRKKQKSKNQKKKKKLPSSVTCFMWVFAIFLLLPVKTSGALSVWLGEDVAITDRWTIGDGSKENPYQIETAAQLAYLAWDIDETGNSYAGEHFLLISNLDLDHREWLPIGTNANQQSKKFRGHFDGGYHTISNLRISGNSDYIGLFGYVEDGTIANLAVFGNVSGGYMVGGVVGKCDNTKVKDCSFAGDITAGYTGFAGGVVAGIVINKAEITVSNLNFNGNIFFHKDNDEQAGYVGRAVGYVYRVEYELWENHKSGS
ncbi:hypothetical protein FACS1894111_06430 [Clostridia bacterium]|nr:hypothetical protein FACS1894111_06430 [Clostridia bacterium]